MAICKARQGYNQHKQQVDKIVIKRQAAIAALDYIKDGVTLGVGSGTTVHQFIAALPQVRV